MSRKKTAHLDDRDRAILRALAQNAWLTYSELAARVNLSPSAAQRRVDKLIEAGAIEGATARIAAFATGRPIMLNVLLELADESSAVLGALARRFQSAPAVETAFYVTGSFDVLLTMRCATMEEYSAFAEKHFNGNPHIRRYKTLTVMRSLL